MHLEEQGKKNQPTTVLSLVEYSHKRVAGNAFLSKTQASADLYGPLSVGLYSPLVLCITKIVSFALDKANSSSLNICTPTPI